MSVLSFFRRIKTSFADDKAVDEFGRVVDQTGILQRSAFDDAMEESERDRQAYFDLIEKVAGEKPPDL